MRKKKRSPRTIAGYESIVRKYSGDWMNRELAGIDDAEVEQRHSRVAGDVKAGKHAARLKHRQKDGRRKGSVIKREGKDGQVTANLWQRVFSVIYNSARKRNRALPENPASSVERFTIERQHSGIKDENLPRWWAGVNQMENKVKADALRVGLFLGLRKTSIVELRRHDVHLDAGVVDIVRPKGGVTKAFSLPLPPYLVDLLRKRIEVNDALAAQGVIEAKAASQWVFPASIASPSATGHISELRAEFEGLEWTPHDLRRCFARVTESLDIGRYALMSMLNHRQSKDTTGKYVEIATERLREPMQRVAEKLLRLVEPKKASITAISKARARTAKSKR
jgi:integrase